MRTSVCTNEATPKAVLWFNLDCPLRTDPAERSGCHPAVSHRRPVRARGRQQLRRRLIHGRGGQVEEPLPVSKNTQEWIEAQIKLL